MSTNPVADRSQPAPPVPPAKQPANIMRQVILWGLLALVVGAYAYDYFVAQPAAIAAEEKLREFVDERNKQSVKVSGMVTPKDVHETLGMTPTFVEKHDDLQYLVEYYCWWGSVPYLNTRRQFLWIVYVGTEPDMKLSSLGRNTPPSPESLPIEPPSLADDKPLPTPDDAAAPPAKEGEEGAAKGEDSPPAEAKTTDDKPADAESPKGKEE